MLSLIRPELLEPAVILSTLHPESQINSVKDDEDKTQTKEISEKLGESKDKCEPIFIAIREYAIKVRVIEKERQARSALHGPKMVSK